MSSITKTEYGTWRLRYRDPQGHDRNRTFKTKADARGHQKQVDSDLYRGTYVDPRGGKVRLSDWIDEWHTARLNLSPTTQARDRIYIANYINTPLGNRQLKHLTPQVIRRWVATLSEDYAPSTVHKAFQLLQAALDAAVRDGLLPANPAHKTPLPRIEKSDHRYLTIDETHDLADAISHRYQALVYTGALAGLRPGEISGLRIDNLDLLRSTLTVTQTATEIAGRLSYGPPKTAAGRRTITIPVFLRDRLGEHLGRYRSDAPFVFTSSQGKPMRWTNLCRRDWKAAVQSSVLDPCPPHTLRHTHAALSIAESIHPRVLMERMGHSSIKVTMDTYGGLFSGYDSDVADALDNVFSTGRVSETRQVSGSTVIDLPAG